MGKEQLEFFASTEDIAHILSAVGSRLPIGFVGAGLVADSSMRTQITLPELLQIVAGPGGSSLVFLVVPMSETIHVREILQKKGKPHYSIDQLANPKCLVLRPGGMLNPSTVLAGQIGTASENPESSELFSNFSTLMRQRFTKIKSYWVGPEALRVLDAGGRLTANVKGLPEYDLKR